MKEEEMIAAVNEKLGKEEKEMKIILRQKYFDKNVKK